MENWKDIEDYEGHYQISDLGRVRSLSRYVKLNQNSEWNNGNRLQRWINGRIIKFQTNRTGYYKVDLCLDGVKTTFEVHRFVAKSFVSNPHKKTWVNHKNGIKKDIKHSNLEWCTRQENMDHAVKTGLITYRGEKCHQSKLTDEKVLQIRTQRGLKPQWKLGKEFNVSQSVIWAILSRKTWTHI